MQNEAGVQKGLYIIITEQGLWVWGMKKQQALKILFQQDNFYPKELSSVLYNMVKNLGDWMDFVPKYHPELNFIDIYWGYVNCKVRNECNYNCHKLLDHVPEALYYMPLIFMQG